jgi:hypothetical protein
MDPWNYFKPLRPCPICGTESVIDVLPPLDLMPLGVRYNTLKEYPPYHILTHWRRTEAGWERVKFSQEPASVVFSADTRGDLFRQCLSWVRLNCSVLIAGQSYGDEDKPPFTATIRYHVYTKVECPGRSS